MSLLGIGSAKIDLCLEKTSFQPGESVKGLFVIQGGTIEQQLKRIECDLVSTDSNEEEKVIETTTIYTSKTIRSDEKHDQLSFSFVLPEELDKSSKELEYRFKTRMIFNEGVKSEDQDFITII